MKNNKILLYTISIFFIASVVFNVFQHNRVKNLKQTIENNKGKLTPDETPIEKAIRQYTDCVKACSSGMFDPQRNFTNEPMTPEEQADLNRCVRSQCSLF